MAIFFTALGDSGKLVYTAYPIVIVVEALAPPHVTVTVPVPGFVELPIFHDQLATPDPSAVFPTSPAAVLCVPAGVT